MHKYSLSDYFQGGHKPGRHGKLREFEKFVQISGKTQGNLLFLQKTWKTQGKCKICNIIVNENVFQGTFLSRVSQGKVWKHPGNLKENSGNLFSKKCGHPDFDNWNRNTIFPSYFDWKRIVKSRIAAHENNAWTEFASVHQDIEILNKTFSCMTNNEFWEIVDRIPDLAFKRNLQIWLMGNFGLQYGAPWLRKVWEFNVFTL